MKVLFIDTAHPILAQELTKLGFHCDYFPDYTRADFEKIIGEYSGVIIRSKITFDKAIIDKAEKLKFIGRVGSGLESIDVEYAASKAILCLNSPEGNRDAVGEHALALLLNLLNNICTANNEVKNGIWEREKNRGTEIKGKTIGIIGYGNMGSAFARKLKGFEAKVIAYDKYRIGFSDENIIEASQQQIFDESDIISFHIPLNNETKFLVDDNYIKRFRKNIFLINTSRGNIVKTDDLVLNLKSGKIRGAALDVLEYEEVSFEKINFNTLPEAFQYLANAENVILTPHIAGWSTESKFKLSMVLVEKIKQTLKNGE